MEEELRDQLVEVWRIELLLGHATPDVDFLEVDGSSLTAVRIINRVQRIVGHDVEIGLLYTYSTPRTLAGVLADSRYDQERAIA